MEFYVGTTLKQLKFLEAQNGFLKLGHIVFQIFGASKLSQNIFVLSMQPLSHCQVNIKERFFFTN
jgi:hypothetical protein